MCIFKFLVIVEGFIFFFSNIIGGKVDIFFVSCGILIKMSFVLLGLISRE